MNRCSTGEDSEDSGMFTISCARTGLGPREIILYYYERRACPVVGGWQRLGFMRIR